MSGRRSKTTWLVLILATGFGGIIAFQQSTIKRLRAESEYAAAQPAKPHEQAAQTNSPPAGAGVWQEEELKNLQRENRDLLRLRNEVHQLREQLQESKRTAAKQIERQKETIQLVANSQQADALIKVIDIKSLGLTNFQSLEALPTSPRNSWIGIVLTASSTDSQTQGVAIQEIAPNSPAAEAQLLKGDRILRINGQQMTNIVELVRTIGSHSPGDKLVLDFIRNGLLAQVSVVTRAVPQ